MAQSEVEPKVAVIFITFPESGILCNLCRHREMLSAGWAAAPGPCNISKRAHENKMWPQVWENKETQFPAWDAWSQQ